MISQPTDGERIFKQLKSQNYCRDDGSAYDGWIVGFYPGIRCARDRNAFSNQGIHPAESGHHFSAGGLKAHICAVNGRIEYDSI